MTKRDYIKYHQELKDYFGKTIIPGAKVVINNHYGNTPYIGIADHFTRSGRVAVKYPYVWSRTGKAYYYWAYRDANTIIILKNGNKNNHKV